MSGTVISPGVPVKLFDNDSTASPVNSISYSIQTKSGAISAARPVAWRVAFAVAPSSVSIQLQGAFNDVDTEYAQLDICNNVNGELRTVSSVLCRYIRARVVTRSGGSGVTIEVMI